MASSSRSFKKKDQIFRTLAIFFSEGFLFTSLLYFMPLNQSNLTNPIVEGSGISWSIIIAQTIAIK